MIPKYNEFPATVRTPPARGSTSWEQQPHEFLPFLLPCKLPQGQASLGGIRHQALLCKNGKKNLPLLPFPSRAPLNAQIQTTKSLTHAIPRRQPQQLTSTSEKSSYMAPGAGWGGRDGGAGAAASHNWIPINWKELADKPWLKSNLGDLKTKTIHNDLGIN